MSVIKSYNLFLSSRNRLDKTNPDTSGFSIYLKDTITKRSSNSVFRCRIIQATIPFSFTEINASNNVMTYVYNSLSYTLTIDIGTYNIISLLTFIKNRLESVHTILLNFVFNSNTNLCSFEFSPSQLGTHSITFSYLLDSNVPILRQLGVTNQDLTLSVVGGVLTTGTTSNQSVNINPSRNLYIRSNTLQQNTGNQENIATEIGSTDILAIIPINFGFSFYINFYDNQSFYSYLNNNSIDFLQFYLTDATSNSPLIGMLLDWSFSLIIEEYMLPTNIDVSPIISTSLPMRQQQQEQLGGITLSQQKELLKMRKNLEENLKRERQRLVDEITGITEQKNKE
jgi:hypothetical protein